MIITYKYIHGIYKVSANYIEHSDLIKTRGHQLKLKKTPQEHHCLHSAFFSTGIVDLWNSLPEQVVLAPTMNSLVTARQTLAPCALIL